MAKNLVIDFVASHSTGKTTVMNEVGHRLKKDGRAFNIVASESRKVAEDFKDLDIYDKTTSLTQCYISLFNWGNVLKSSMEYPITLCTDWAVRSLAYTMCSEKIDDKLINMHKLWLDHFHSESFTHHANVFHVYIPIEFEVIPDGVRTLDEDYRKRVDSTIKYIFDTCKIPYMVLSGSVGGRVRGMMDFINKVTCWADCNSI